VAFSTSRLDFGNQFLGYRSAAQTLKIINFGTGPLVIRSISFTGANPDDFVISKDSGEGTLAPGASRTLGIQFRPNPPLYAEARSASLVVCDNAVGSPQLVALTGTAVEKNREKLSQ
jgi:hypothetical protein